MGFNIFKVKKSNPTLRTVELENLYQEVGTNNCVHVDFNPLNTILQTLAIRNKNNNSNELAYNYHIKSPSKSILETLQVP